MKRLASVALGLGLLAGCAVARSAPIPEGESRSTVAVPPPKPEDFLHLSLDRARVLVVQRNPDLKAAAERMEVARARLGEALSSFYPQVGVRLSYLRTDHPAQAFGMIVGRRDFSPALDVNDPGPTENLRPEVYGAINLYRGGQDAHLSRAARFGIEASSLQREAIRNALLEAITSAYYGALAAREQQEVAASSLKAVDAELADARTRLTAGAALKSDVLSLEVRSAAAKEGVLRARHGVELAKASLRFLLALPPEEPLNPVPAPAETRPPPPTFGDALNRALHDRPDLRGAATAVDVRRSELDAERGTFLPRLDAFGAYGQDNDSFAFDRAQDNWSFGVVLELEVFGGFRSVERVRGAERRLGEARALLEKARLSIEQEVRAAFLALEEARERLVVAEGSVAKAEEALRLVREQVAAGAATVTRFLEAEAALADTRSRTLAARFDIRRSEARLRNAIGESP